MVGKLLKHEFIALGRVLVPAAIVVPILAVLSSLSLFGSPVGRLATVLLDMLFVVSILVIISLTYIFCIKRFYDSVFSKQGYMTLALPITPMQLLFSKTFAAVVAVLFSFVVIVVAGELYGLIQGDELFGNIIEILFIFSDTGHIVYGLFVGLISIISGFLFIYACISAGQTFNKHRMAIAVIIGLVLGQILAWIQRLIQLNILNSYLALTAFLIQSLIVGVASVFFICYILKNKVNLLA